MSRAWILALGALLAPGVLGAEAGDPPTLSVLTVGPGAVYWQRYGHNAIVLRTPGGEAVAFNYGIFDFGEKDFLVNFVRGRMRYRLAVQPLAAALDYYRDEGRWAVEQVLSLSPAERSRLGEFLEWNARPENMYYRYDYFRANCSTKVRDALDRALAGGLRSQLAPRPAGFTYRAEALRLSSPDFLLMLGIDALLGPAVDRPIDEWAAGFSPTALMRALRSARTAGDGALVVREQPLLPVYLPDPPAKAPQVFAGFALLGLAIALALLACYRGRATRAGRIATATLGTGVALFAGVLASIMAGLWAFSEHADGWGNQNLLLFAPLTLLLLPAWMGARPMRAARAISLLWVFAAVGALALRLLQPQDNLHWFALLLPVHAAGAWVLWRAGAPAETPT